MQRMELEKWVHYSGLQGPWVQGDDNHNDITSKSPHQTGPWSGCSTLTHVAMGIQTFCCVALCVWVAKHTNAGVTQTPKQEVTKRGQAVTLRCEPISDHKALYWYRQTVVRRLELLTYFRSLTLMNEGEMPKDRFTAQMPNASFSILKIQPAEPSDSAVYLCASSLATALWNHPLPAQKPWVPLLPPVP
ncbi:T-cell receptor beta chain V region YT35 [Heterocephalus glaber]|nr:T-cell receptor beta chain V region YT35 [Heterocephalus glaber]